MGTRPVPLSDNGGTAGAPYALLDGPLAALVQDIDDVLAPVTVVAVEERALFAFSSRRAAEAHLRSLPAEASPRLRVAFVAADDLRGKEELLRAGAAAGATLLDLDPDDDLRPRASIALAQAIAYIASFRRNSACF